MWLCIFYCYNPEEQPLQFEINFWLTKMPPPVELNSPLTKNLGGKFYSSNALPASIKVVTSFFCGANIPHHSALVAKVTSLNTSSYASWFH